MIGTHRNLALDLPLTELPILEDQIQTIDHLPDVVEALFRDRTIESTLQLDLGMIEDPLVLIRTIGVDLGIIGDLLSLIRTIRVNLGIIETFLSSSKPSNKIR